MSTYGVATYRNATLRKAAVLAVVMNEEGYRTAEFEVRVRWLTPDEGEPFLDINIGCDDLDFPHDVRKILRVRVDGEIVHDVDKERS